MAFHASHTRVRRRLIRGEFRMHDGVTQLSAELHRVRELIRLVAAHRAHQRKDHYEAEDKRQRAALGRIVQIELWEVMWGAQLAQTTSPLDHHANWNQDQTQHQKSRRHHVREDADVRDG